MKDLKAYLALWGKLSEEIFDIESEIDSKEREISALKYQLAVKSASLAELDRQMIQMEEEAKK
jgi:SMC interacting uncharacterized protein involved in chromosome segregation